jgi:homoserine O-acetyltransferase
MKTLLLFVACHALLAQTPLATGVKSGVTPERHEFVIADFRTEGGVTLPKARVVYGTYGRLNADKSNAVLLPSHYGQLHDTSGSSTERWTLRAFWSARSVRQRSSSSPSNLRSHFTGRASQ